MYHQKGTSQGGKAYLIYQWVYPGKRNPGPLLRLV
jgi:hypothetical protein